MLKVASVDFSNVDTYAYENNVYFVLQDQVVHSDIIARVDKKYQQSSDIEGTTLLALSMKMLSQSMRDTTVLAAPCKTLFLQGYYVQFRQDETLTLSTLSPEGKIQTVPLLIGTLWHLDTVVLGGVLYQVRLEGTTLELWHIGTLSHHASIEVPCGEKATIVSLHDNDIIVSWTTQQFRYLWRYSDRAVSAVSLGDLKFISPYMFIDVKKNIVHLWNRRIISVEMTRTTIDWSLVKTTRSPGIIVYNGTQGKTLAIRVFPPSVTGAIHPILKPVYPFPCLDISVDKWSIVFLVSNGTKTNAIVRDRMTEKDLVTEVPEGTKILPYPKVLVEHNVVSSCDSFVNFGDVEQGEEIVRSNRGKLWAYCREKDFYTIRNSRNFNTNCYWLPLAGKIELFLVSSGTQGQSFLLLYDHKLYYAMVSATEYNILPVLVPEMDKVIQSEESSIFCCSNSEGSYLLDLGDIS